MSLLPKKHQITTNNKKYNRLAIIIHWLSVPMIWGLFFIGFYMVDLSYYSKWYITLPSWHIGVGIVLLIITVVRLFNTIHKPKLTIVGWQKTVAKIGHYTLLIILIIVLISGYLIQGETINLFNVFELPSLVSLSSQQSIYWGDIHRYSSYILLILTMFHTMVSLWHHFVLKDNTLRRMGVTKYE